MSDDQALLAAILADPAEDTPRLVYADWLGENGQEERAEFIRVQCELARNHPAHHTAETGCPLRRRERELLSDENKAAWFGSTYFNRISASYSRGFVSALTCSWPDWSQHADAILRAWPIERVKSTTRPSGYPVPAGMHYDDTAKCWRHESWPRIEFELPPVVNGAEWGRMNRTFAENLDLIAAENR